MSLVMQKPKDALNKALAKLPLGEKEFERFKSNLRKLLDGIRKDEFEEHHKNLVSRFLRETWYDPDHAINTKKQIDLVIHNGKTSNSPAGVMIEAKRPKQTPEMVTTDNLNTKALHELLYYFLQERLTENNLEVKRLIITNVYEWFIFDAQTFDKLFAGDPSLRKKFKDFKRKALSGTTTDVFYPDIAQPAIEAVDGEIPFTHVDLRDYETALKSDDPKPADVKKLVDLYKVFSPEHLLKKPFVNDSNTLDKDFYAELLHIIGLTEIKKKGKKLIVRPENGTRNPASLLENAIEQVDSRGKIHRLANATLYGESEQERLFNVCLELCMTWVNRTLFLKLLEGQLIRFHDGDESYAFLNSERIRNYDDLNTLFFSVLAREYDERTPDDASHFENVPYLNSSLFEPSEIEHRTIDISGLRDDRELPLYSKTILKDSNGKKRTGTLNALAYLFEFLNAYDYGSQGVGEIQEDNKPLLNASVLGLIFEKINGYKDGSFFTPGFITMYMCRETIRRAVVQRFNEVKGWECKTLDDVYNRDVFKKSDDLAEANAIINSITICDPAVGSGHFLVSALNEIIAVKSDLNILTDRDGRRLKEYDVEVVNDELVVSDENDDFFEYRPGSSESQRVQEALFHEKQTIIENCLFGVDINPNSVNICRLRLWIELLKNAYYRNPGSRNPQLETLPNIDINIKCGNSLVSQFPLDSKLAGALKKSNWTIDGYRTAVAAYRNANSKEEKRDLEKLIADIKRDFAIGVRSDDPTWKELDKEKSRLFKLTQHPDLFGKDTIDQEEWDKEVSKRTKRIQKLEAKLEEIRSNPIYENALEWRFEFPEALDDNGDFVGFDVIIGNPPYLRHETLGAEHKAYLKDLFAVYAGKSDIYVYFVEQGMALLKAGGVFSYIVSNKWIRAGYGEPIRRWLKQQGLIKLVDFGDLPVFEEATTYPCILVIEKSESKETFNAVEMESLEFNDLAEHVAKHAFAVERNALEDVGWTLVDRRTQHLLDKLYEVGVPLGEYVNGEIYRGVVTGRNKVFVIDLATRDKLIAEDPQSTEVIKPFLRGRDINRYQSPQAEKYLLFIPWHFPLHDDESISGASRTAEAEFSSQYPAVYHYLLRNKDSLESRNKTETGIRYEWYALQRCAATYYKEFDKPKIIIPALASRASYAFDDQGHYSNDKTSIIPTTDLYLLGLLNSKVLDLVMHSISSTKRGGYFEYKPMYVEQLPIRPIDFDDPEDAARHAKMINLVERMLKLHAQPETEERNDAITATDREIDGLVYQLYGLTEEEVGIVEGAIGLSQG